MQLVATLLLAQAEPKTHNPIVPAANEVIWGSITFTILFILIAKVGYPRVRQGMEARSERIRKSLEDADRTRDEAQSILEDYQRQLNDAKGEAARIIEEARQAADKLRQDLKRQAEAEVADIKQRAHDDINAHANRVKADLQANVALLSIELAEKVVGRNLDREANTELVERFINEMEAARS